VAAEASQREGAQRGADEAAVRGLPQRLWDAWNERNAEAFADLFGDDGHVVGFDGSTMDGRAEVAEHLRQIFADHQPARYVGKIKAVDFLAPDVALVRVIAGMVPPGKADIHAPVNAVQFFVAVRRDGGWRLASYQNTPAQFFGRPELAEAFTDELRQLL
jgi:uncharacterized protein (TIGR02246 family)